ncbi:MAG: SH3 domain-containing protein [Pseudooceanicola sp.]
MGVAAAPRPSSAQAVAPETLEAAFEVALDVAAGTPEAGLTDIVETAAEPDAGADDDARTAAGAQQMRATGPVTHLPLPRYVSMKAREGNVRRGPSLTHRIDWVYKRQDMPLQIVAEHGHWRRVRDHDGMGGWIHYSLLSGARTVLVEDDIVTLRLRPDLRSTVVARLEQGVVARLDDCLPDWCKLRVGPYRGWAVKRGLWGVAADELRD